MNTKSVRINTDNYLGIKQVILDIDEPDSFIEFDQGFQCIYEKYSFLNKNRYVQIILVIKHEEYINVSISSGGASTGFLISINWGTEKSSINKSLKEIKLWCNSNGINYKEIE